MCLNVMCVVSSDWKTSFYLTLSFLEETFSSRFSLFFFASLTCLIHCNILYLQKWEWKRSEIGLTSNNRVRGYRNRKVTLQSYIACTLTLLRVLHCLYCYIAFSIHCFHYYIAFTVTLLSLLHCFHCYFNLHSLSSLFQTLTKRLAYIPIHSSIPSFFFF